LCLNDRFGNNNIVEFGTNKKDQDQKE
jgi:hypothetical protein